MRNMKYYEDIFLDLQIRIAASVSIYKGSCEKLLSPLNLPDKTMFELLEVCEGRAWDGLELGEKLRDRLGNDCILYRALVKQLNKKMVLFAKKLKLGEGMRVGRRSILKLDFILFAQSCTNVCLNIPAFLG